MSRIQPIAMIILALVVLPYRAVRRGKNAPGRGPKKGGSPGAGGRGCDRQANGANRRGGAGPAERGLSRLVALQLA
jgi:hypothetical protein